jgi:hypothetical protein
MDNNAESRPSISHADQSPRFKKMSTGKSPSRRTSQYKNESMDSGIIKEADDVNPHSRKQSDARLSIVNRPGARQSLVPGRHSIGGRPSVYAQGRYSKFARRMPNGGSNSEYDHHGLPSYENTYHLGPKEDEKFSVTQVQVIIDEELNKKLTGRMYNSDECKELTQDLSDLIKKRVKELGFRRYKILCCVVIGQNVDQGADGTSRCLWDASVDTVATAKFKNSSLFAFANVFGVYFE